MTHMLTTIGFDADDTLWANETHFRDAQARFESLLADYAPADDLHDRLLATDLAIKTGKLPDDLALDLLVVELSQRR